MKSGSYGLEIVELCNKVDTEVQIGRFGWITDGQSRVYKEEQEGS